MPKQKPTIACLACGEMFVRKRKNMKFCGSDCAYRHRRWRETGKPIDAPKQFRVPFDPNVYTCSKCGWSVARPEKRYCVPCSRKRAADWQRDNPEKARRKRVEWRQENIERCRETKRAWRARNPSKNAEAKARYYRKHKERVKKMIADWHRRNPEMTREAKRRFRAANRDKINARNRERRQWIRDGNVSKADLISIYEAAGGRCAYCGAAVDTFNPKPTWPTGFDHVVPMCHGGEHAVGNLVVCCPPCNFKKNSNDPEEWMASIGMSPADMARVLGVES